MSKKVERSFIDQQSLKADYGRLADRIEMVLSVLRLADNLYEVPNVPPTRRHKLTGNFQGCWALDIDKNRRMIVKPNVDSDDLKRINELEILEIVDYH